MTLLNRWLSGSSAYGNYQAFVRQIVEPLYNRLGVEVVATEHKLERYARSIAINLACQAGLEKCLNQSAEKLQQVIDTGAKIAPDLQSSIYCNGLRQANVTTFFYLQNKMFQSEDQAERTLIINALGCAQDSTLLTQYLNLAILPGDALRLQEKSRVLLAPVNNGELGLRVMMEFIRYNFHAIIAISPTQVNSMLSNIATRIASQALFEEFNSLLTLLQAYGGITEGNGVNYRASANVNLVWQTANMGAIETWFQNGGTTTAPSTESTTLGAGSAMISTVALISCALAKYLL
jgi:aminopeptidase N